MKVFNTAFVLFFCLCLKGHSQNIVNELLAAWCQRRLHNYKIQ